MLSRLRRSGRALSFPEASPLSSAPPPSACSPEASGHLGDRHLPTGTQSGLLEVPLWEAEVRGVCSAGVT